MTMSENTTHIGEADGAGRILLEGQEAPVSYHLKATWDGGTAYEVRIEVSAPRDWLLDGGFDREATLERENGDKLQVRFDDKLDVDDNISVSLEAAEQVEGSLDDLTARFPELGEIARARAAH